MISFNFYFIASFTVSSLLTRAFPLRAFLRSSAVIKFFPLSFVLPLLFSSSKLMLVLLLTLFSCSSLSISLSYIFALTVAFDKESTFLLFWVLFFTVETPFSSWLIILRQFQLWLIFLTLQLLLICSIYQQFQLWLICKRPSHIDNGMSYKLSLLI